MHLILKTLIIIIQTTVTLTNYLKCQGLYKCTPKNIYNGAVLELHFKMCSNTKYFKPVNVGYTQLFHNCQNGVIADSLNACQH